MTQGTTYEEAIGKAADAIVDIWAAEDAGEHSDEARKWRDHWIDIAMAVTQASRREVAADAARRAQARY